MEQVATLANLSRKTVYRWVNDGVANPKHWYQVVALGKALRLHATENPSFEELKDLVRYEYEPEEWGRLLKPFEHECKPLVTFNQSDMGIVLTAV